MNAQKFVDTLVRLVLEEGRPVEEAVRVALRERPTHADPPPKDKKGKEEPKG